MEGYFSGGEKKVKKVFRELFILKSNNTFIFLDLTWRLINGQLSPCLPESETSQSPYQNRQPTKITSPKKAYYKLQKKQE